MNSKTVHGLYEAYAAVYNQDLREELEEINEANDVFYIAESLDEDSLEEIMEEVVSELILEGIEVCELDEIMEAVLLELNPYASGGSKEADEYNKHANKVRKSAKNAAKRAETVAKVKGAAKSAVGAVKAKASEVKDSAQKAVKDTKQQSHIGLAKYASGRNLMPGAGLKTQSSSGRGELRRAVVGDIASRVKGKIADAGNKVRSSVQAVGQKAVDTGSAAKGAIKDAASSAKAGIKKGIRGFALGVARRMREETDIYEIVLSHLLDEGYAESEQAAEAIMVNMSEDWREDILEEILDERNRGEEGMSDREVSRRRNLGGNTRSKVSSSSLGDHGPQRAIQKFHSIKSKQRQELHKTARGVRGDTGESGGQSRYQANKDHKNGYPSITKRGQGPF